MKILVLSILSFGLFISGCVKEFTLDKFDLYETEGFIACLVAAEQSNPQPDKPDVTKCPCNGTGKVKTGDGLNTTQCPCGDKCQCGKTTISKHKKRCILFTSPKNCSPCKKFDKNEMPKLKKQNWTFGDRDSIIEIVNCDLKDNTWMPAKYADLLKEAKIDLASKGIPCFVILEEEKIIGYAPGISTAKEFTDFFYNTGK